MRCGFSSSCFCTGSFEPDDSATYSRPSSSNEATIGRSTSGGPAASSIENPSGTFGSGGEGDTLSAAEIALATEIAVRQQARNRTRFVMPQLQRRYAMYRWSITWQRLQFSPLVLATDRLARMYIDQH